MLNLVRRSAQTAAILLTAALATTGTASAQSVTAVPKLDLNRFVGAWHEVARLPNKQQKACISNAVALYAVRYKANRFTLVTSCQTDAGPEEGVNSDGKADKSGDGKLKITTVWPLTQKRWVLALGPTYDWALIGSPNHKSLWILSRTPTLSPEVLADIKAKAAAQGFNPANLISSQQR